MSDGTENGWGGSRVGSGRKKKVVVTLTHINTSGVLASSARWGAVLTDIGNTIQRTLGLYEDALHATGAVDLPCSILRALFTKSDWEWCRKAAAAVLLCIACNLGGNGSLMRRGGKVGDLVRESSGTTHPNAVDQEVCAAWAMCDVWLVRTAAVAERIQEGLGMTKLNVLHHFVSYPYTMPALQEALAADVTLPAMLARDSVVMEAHYATACCASRCCMLPPLPPLLRTASRTPMQTLTTWWRPLPSSGYASCTLATVLYVFLTTMLYMFLATSTFEAGVLLIANMGQIPTVPVPLRTRSVARNECDNTLPIASTTTLPSILTPLPNSPNYGPDSDSNSSDNSSSLSPRRNTISTHSTIYAEVEDHSSCPPVLTRGDITPLIACNFENAALNWFALKGVPEASQVTNILGCFRDMHHIAWLCPNAERTHVTKLSFNDFMAEFCGKYLPVDWQAATWNEILSSHMKASVSARCSMVPLLPLTTPVSATPSKQACALTSRLNIVWTPSLTPLPMIRWTSGAAKQWCDKKHICDIAKQCRITAEIHKAEKQKAASDGNRNSKKPFSSSLKGNTFVAAAAPPSTLSAAPKGCQKLMEGEHALLNKHDGCNKCRKFYAGHRSNNCPNDFPDLAMYRTLTVEDAAATAKKVKTKSSAAKPSATIAVVMDAVSDSDDSEDSDRSVSDIDGFSPSLYPISTGTVLSTAHLLSLLCGCLD
ncbi:hypothetical protein DFH08DRAFT_972064 [Mycena albidolilacea]|uniref:Uncharacterized protein n=1 Tax=Mycena albidolilacea TaxID=1033008 RepID=A0AAD6ZCH9_9AGAR|nr:hypothetical protein DFH08DRAFT_972064 [Mycena albidolilacea]